MVKDNAWKQIIRDGIVDALWRDIISVKEAILLYQSIDYDVNEPRMQRDTEHRLRRNK